jgi:hypothetical protein
VETAIVTEKVEQVVEGYAPGDERPPFGWYALLATTFNGALATFLWRRRERLPERVPLADVILIGVASHKLSRLVTKAKITSFLRAPFTRYSGSGGPGEVEEKPRGEGLRRVVGGLLTCPFCLGLWIAGAFAAAFAAAARPTRLVASVFAALTISDFLQIAYKAAEKQGLGD